MKKKLRAELIISAAGLLISAILLSAISFAWLSDSGERQLTVSGSSITGYFAGGDGKSATPYIINDAIHLYNLSWLQSKDEIAPGTFFRLAADIDMGGKLTGPDGNETGAIPPIGTKNNPFLGIFDGNNHVISNIWVSSNPDDWKEKPAQALTQAELADLTTHVGFFGSVDQSGEQVGLAKNLILENIEITVNSASTVGLVAGYVNGNMDRVGVKNGKITVTGGSYNVKSDTSLVGEVGPAVTWENRPGMSGGNLIVDPNADGDPFNHDIAANTYHDVPNSVDNRAFYTGELNTGTVSGGIGGKYLYNGTFEWGKSTTPIQKTNCSNITSSSEIDPVLRQHLMAGKNSAQAIKYYVTLPNIPTSDNLIAVSEIGQSVPKNGVWFRPAKGGTCYIAMTVTNMGGAGYWKVSMYGYKRTATGAIDTATWKETSFQGTATFKNKDVVVFKVDVPADGYEFIIGCSSQAGNTSAGFTYLSLAGVGADDVPSGMTGATIKVVDYAQPVGSSYDILADGYKMKEASLHFNSSYGSAAGQSLYFNTNTRSGAVKVCYSNNTIISDRVSATVGLYEAYSEAAYPTRKKTSDTTP